MKAVGRNGGEGLMNIDSLGFTGTQRGMSQRQRDRVRELLLELRPNLVRHGACVGSDDEFDAIAAELHIPREAHPCTISSKRVPDHVLQGRAGSSVVIHPPAPPLQRNHTVVDLTKATIACPLEPSEVLRSGTWATVRYAKKRLKLLSVIAREEK